MVNKGYSPPTITSESIQVFKLEENYEENKMKKDSLNAKAINALVYVLSFDELNIVCDCSTTKEVWNF